MAQTFKPPATQRVYDVCVIGSQLGGVAAGALLARRGYRVLHVDHDGLGASYEDGGWLLPYAPAVLPSPRAFPAAEAVLSELGLTSDLTRAFEPSHPDLQLMLPRHRLDLHRDPAARSAELKREWSADAERLEAGLARLQGLFDAGIPFFKAMPPLPPRGLLDRWRLEKARRIAASVPGTPPPAVGAEDPFEGLDGHPLATALRAAHRFLGYLDGEPSRLSLTRLLGAALRGSYRLPGGQAGLREILRRKIADSRGELLGGEGAPAIAESLEVSRGRVAAVRLADSDDSYVARAFVSATDAPALRRIIPGGGEKLAALLDTVRPARQMLALNFVVKLEGLPPGLGETVLALPPGASEDAALLLQVLPARRSGKKGAPEVAQGERVLAVGGFVAARSRDHGRSHLGDLASGLRARLAEVLPYLERHLVHESIPELAVPAEGRGSRLLPHPLYEVNRSQTLGVTGLPCRTPLKNLVLAGREVVPGLGVEGEFHAAWQAAAEVERLLGKKDGLK